MTPPCTPTPADRAHNERRRESQRINPRWKKDWAEFVQKCEKRCRQGHREYGDESFDRSAFSLLEEMEEEVLDTAVWGFITWTRLHSLRERMQILEDKMGEVEMRELIEEVGDE